MPEPYRFTRSLVDGGANRLSRRASLVGLVGAALAKVVASPTSARAGKAGKKARNACRRQVGQCRTSVTNFCAVLPVLEPEVCEAAFRPCCASFEDCLAGQVQACWVEALQIIEF